MSINSGKGARLYEQWGLIPKPKRKENGYRVFNELHVQQIQLVLTAFQIEIVQNGLRKKIIEMVKASAQGDFEKAARLTEEYIAQLEKEHDNAEEAIRIVRHILSGGKQEGRRSMKRKEVSVYLGISMDTLRNWEMNGLLTVKRKENGYRIYTDNDIKRLKIIRSLRCANYSLEAILRMLRQLSIDPAADIRAALNTSNHDDIISVCDRLLISLSAAKKNAYKILDMLAEMKIQFS